MERGWDGMHGKKAQGYNLACRLKKWKSFEKMVKDD